MIKNDISKLLGVGLVLMSLILLVNIRDLFAVGMIFSVIIQSLIVMAGLMGWVVYLTGSENFYFTIINSSMPIILLKIANSDGVHVVTKFFKEMRGSGNTKKSIAKSKSKEFLFSELENLYCSILEMEIDRRNFKKKFLITGASKENFDCTWQVYWDDGINPSRTLNLDNIPWAQHLISDESDDCKIYEDTEPLCLDCEKIRLAPLIETPCIEISKSPDGGMLRNGTYQVFIAYVINDQTIGDYYGISNVQPLWEHEDTISGLDIKLSNLDKGFEYFKLVICSNNQMEMQAKEIGIYSTEQEFISIDYINQKLKTVPIEVLPLRNPAYEKSDNMYVVNDYLIRQGPTEQFDFNYQPLANKIHVHWTSWQFPADYYRKGGSKPTFMRDEVYAFFIRFIYNTGERSSSFHIPGKVPGNFSLPDGTVVGETDPLPGDPSEIASTIDGAADPDRAFEIYNTTDSWWTATGGSSSAEPDTDDGGVKTAEGHMAYWESSEKYPNDPVRYGDLCSQPIRHHKFPDETIPVGTSGVTSGPNGPLDRSSNDNQSINILGARFYNIEWPRFNGQSNPDDVCDPLDPSPTGAIIPNIVGYEILVGSREGNNLL